MQHRIDTLLRQLKDNQTDSVFITSMENVYYVSNYYTDPHERLVAVFADQKDAPLLILPAMEKEDALKAGWKEEMLTYHDHENVWQLFKDYLKERGRVPASMGVEKDHMSVIRLEMLQQILPEVSFGNATEFLQYQRIIKDKKEYTLLKQAAVLADYGVKKGIEAIAAGKTELQITAELEYALKQEGVTSMSFATTVLSGAKTASPHGTPDGKQIAPGDLVLFDLGVVFEGYCSDITRTVGYKHVTADQQHIHDTVRVALEKATAASQAGTAIAEIDKAARSHIEQAGYGQYFTHRVGHGLGIGVHEFPSLSSNNTQAMQEGMCYTIEPGIYMPGVGGVRIEDDIFLTKNGPDVLTAYPRDLQIIG
ncbi:Xaa-Pro dipeptidase [Terribacillus aidingensis]|uniref:Xaa-Pro dipeptidase n=1 Tax=Terribacillus aidingensis TaxID=586416 RepID=A0A285P8K0_9BACI|nr:Xaa-Pro peptidase family protein [Terribacillus aidingensis]SNZ18060.1 Xaa-Pro dipeptidase [Terribacillus aidingensis]